LPSANLCNEKVFELKLVLFAAAKRNTHFFWPLLLISLLSVPLLRKPQTTGSSLLCTVELTTRSAVSLPQQTSRESKTASRKYFEQPSWRLEGALPDRRPAIVADCDETHFLRPEENEPVASVGLVKKEGAPRL
jgi:hypothetical protein